MTNSETAASWLRAWNDRDTDAMLATLHPQARITDHGFDRQFEGHDGAREWMQFLWEGLDATVPDEPELVESGDSVIVQCVGEARPPGEFAGVAAAGTIVKLPLFMVLTFDADGTITAYDGYRDQNALMAQLTGDTSHQQSFSAGDVIVREGDPSDSFYLLRSGEVGVNRGGADVDTMVSGQYFGERGLLSGEPRNATVTALTDVEVDVVEATAFHDMVSSNAQVAAALAESARQRG